MDSLYADPDRKVINYIYIYFLAWYQGNKCSTLDVFNWRISYSGDYNSDFLFCNRHTMCWAYTLDLVELSSIQLVYVPFLFSAHYLSRTIFFMICMYFWKTMIRQAKVFSRFEALQKAVKNYTIEATPDDRSSVLQQVWTLISLQYRRSCVKVYKSVVHLVPTYFSESFTLPVFIINQGGMFVFKGKQLLYARKDEGTGDHAPLDDVLDVCCKVPVS